jgi:hypothetical protein
MVGTGDVGESERWPLHENAGAVRSVDITQPSHIPQIGSVSFGGVFTYRHSFLLRTPEVLTGKPSLPQLADVQGALELWMVAKEWTAGCLLGGCTYAPALSVEEV